MEVLVLGMDFFSKLIYLWVLGRPKKMGFDLGLLVVILYICESKHVCTIIFEERDLYFDLVLWGLGI